MLLLLHITHSTWVIILHEVGMNAGATACVELPVFKASLVSNTQKSHLPAAS